MIDILNDIPSWILGICLLGTIIFIIIIAIKKVVTIKAGKLEFKTGESEAKLFRVVRTVIDAVDERRHIHGL